MPHQDLLGLRELEVVDDAHEVREPLAVHAAVHHLVLAVVEEGLRVEARAWTHLERRHHQFVRDDARNAVGRGQRDVRAPPAAGARPARRRSSRRPCGSSRRCGRRSRGSGGRRAPACGRDRPSGRRRRGTSRRSRRGCRSSPGRVRCRRRRGRSRRPPLRSCGSCRRCPTSAGGHSRPLASRIFTFASVTSPTLPRGSPFLRKVLIAASVEP